MNLLDLDDKAHSEYLDYLRQLGILLQTFTASSVFTLDHLHRLYVHETSSVWNVIENSLENTVLKKKDDVNKQFQDGSGGGGQSSRRSDQSSRRSSHHSVATGGQKVVPADAVCWLYNLPKGCFWGEKCIYPHVCSYDNCRQNHPACRHGDFVKSRGDQGKSSS